MSKGPVSPQESCSCSCHSCCVPLDAWCDDCQDDHEHLTHALEDVPRAGADVMDRVLEGLRGKGV